MLEPLISIAVLTMSQLMLVKDIIIKAPETREPQSAHIRKKADPNHSNTLITKCPFSLGQLKLPHPGAVTLKLDCNRVLLKRTKKQHNGPINENTAGALHL